MKTSKCQPKRNLLSKWAFQCPKGRHEQHPLPKKQQNNSNKKKQDRDQDPDRHHLHKHKHQHHPQLLPLRKLVLSDEQEMELADWLKENPMLYTKSMKEYKDTARKIDLWNSKAAELDLESGPLLKTWYESVRTKVGKLSDKKSGSATKDMTDRDTFLMQNFGFLASHIARVKGRPACSVSINLHYYCDFSSHFYYMML